MAKIITAEELASLVSTLLINPHTVGEMPTTSHFASFMTDIAKVVCDHCGGVVKVMAAPVDGNPNAWSVGIHGNDSLPDDGGVWRSFDPQGCL